MEDMNHELPTGEMSSEMSSQTETPAGKITPLRATTAIFNGLGIGLLLGILLGLSISPVVSGVIATISSLLAILIGLNEKYIDPLKSLRIGAFGLFTVAGILLGLWLRSTDPFKPTLLDQKKEYIAIGYSEEEARQFITASVLADTGKTRREAHVLYSSTVDAGACDMLAYATTDAPLKETMNTFAQAGGTWKEFADVFQKDLPGALSGPALLAMRDCFCGLTSTGTISVEKVRQSGSIGNHSSLEDIESALAASGQSWQAVVSLVRERFPEKDRKEIYLSVIKVLNHD